MVDVLSMGFYGDNLSLLLKSGYPMHKANELARKLAEKQKAEAKAKDLRENKSKVQSLLKRYKVR